MIYLFLEYKAKTPVVHNVIFLIFTRITNIFPIKYLTMISKRLSIFNFLIEYKN